MHRKQNFKPEGMRSLVRASSTWEDNIKRDFILFGIAYEGVNCFQFRKGSSGGIL
jgi:hypothetical protein